MCLQCKSLKPTARTALSRDYPLRSRQVALAPIGAALLTISVISSAAAVPYTDTVGYPTGFVAPSEAATYDFPYYRFQGQDWSWTHTAIASPFTTASLNISAFDVDFVQAGYTGERDSIFAYDNGVPVFLGYLGGAGDVYAFTAFNLSSNFFDDIAAGLQVSQH